MSIPKRAPTFVETDANDVAELAQPHDLAKWVADSDPEVAASPRAWGIPRAYVLLSLVVAGWAIVVGVVWLVRAVTGL